MNEVQAVSLVRFAVEAGKELRHPDAAQWRERLDRRYSECEAALRWLLDSGRADEGLRLAVALVDFWQYTDRISEGRTWLDRALVERTAEDALRAEALFQAGLLAFWKGDDEATLALHRRSLGLARRPGQPTAIALALTGLARVELRTDIERTRALCFEALDVVDGTSDQRGRSNALHVLGVAAQMRGQFSEARAWMSQRLELAREMSDLRSVAAEAGNLSVVEQQLGDLSRARALAEESLRTGHRLGDTWLIPYCLNSLAAIAVATSDYERAATLLSAADRMVTEQGAAWPPDEGPHFEHSRAAAVQALDPTVFERAWSAGRAFALDQGVSYALGPT
jgi:tetratricopeptide (TPR) repeat protein